MSNVRDPITIIVDESIAVRFFASSFHVVEAFVPFVMKRKKEREKKKKEDGARTDDSEIPGSRRVQRTNVFSRKKRKRNRLRECDT